MTTVLSEGELTFKFSAKWKPYKFDEPVADNFYHRVKHQGVKGVDFIALSEKTILLMEVKHVIADNKHSRIRLHSKDDDVILDRVKQKLSCREKRSVLISSSRPYVAEEIINKIKDTLLVLFAGFLNEDEKLSSYNQAIFLDKHPIIFIFFLERKGELNLPENFKPMASNLKMAIEQKVSFLGNIKVDVVNTHTLPKNLGIEVLVGSPDEAKL